MHKQDTSLYSFTEFVNNNIKTLHATQKNGTLELKNDLLNHSVVMNFFPLIMGIIACFTGGAGIALGILLIIVSLFNLFRNLESITKVTIDANYRKLFIKHLLMAPIEIKFREVIKISIEEVHSRRSLYRYNLIAHLSGGEEVILFDVPNEEDAEALKPKLLHLLT